MRLIDCKRPNIVAIIVDKQIIDEFKVCCVCKRKLRTDLIINAFVLNGAIVNAFHKDAVKSLCEDAFKSVFMKHYNDLGPRDTMHTLGISKASYYRRKNAVASN